MLISEITHRLELMAPLARQEEYDNSGLQVGLTNVECTGVLVCVDVTPAVVNEAIEVGCNLIISHHPLLFKPLKKITGSSAVEECVMMALASGVAIYSAHTSLDNAPGGVSSKMASMLGLKDVDVLDPQVGRMLKLGVFVPNDAVDTVSEALFAAGAGCMGNYEQCSYSSTGTGSWVPMPGASPKLGNVGEKYVTQETRLEMVLPVWNRSRVEEVLKSEHPYEEPAYEFFTINNAERFAGAGAVGNLPEPISVSELVLKVKSTFGTPMARCSLVPGTATVLRVAVCGGSGSFLLPKAIAAGAQAFITSDAKYHDFVDYGQRIMIIDIGHYEGEQCTKSIFYHLIRENFPNFAVRYSCQDINPIKYM